MDMLKKKNNKTKIPLHHKDKIHRCSSIIIRWKCLYIYKDKNTSTL
jgi:hypothetical protein